MIHLAIVGCGGMASGWHVQQLALIPEVAVTALVDPMPESTRAFKEKHFPEAKEYSSFEQLLASPPAKLDAVLLVTPHALHYPQAKAALLAGLHVLVEKPMVTRSADAYDLWKAVMDTGLKLGITFQAPYTQEYQALAKLRDSGELGMPQIIQGWLAQGWMKGTAGKWRQDPRQSGGGQMYDSGAHVLNGMMWLMNSPVIEVGCFYNNAGAPVDINGVAIMKFQNGALGSVAIGGNSVGWDVSIQLQTDRGVYKTGPHGGSLDCTRDGKKFYPPVTPDIRPAGNSPHLNFVDAILGRADLQAPVRYGVLLSALMDALYESADNAKIVKVKPVPAHL